MRGIARLLAGLLTALWLVWGGLALAQTEGDAPDFLAWEGVAQQAESLIGDSDTSDDRLDALRGELAAWRTQFLDAQSVNSIRIETVQEQISALGAAPAEGETEPRTSPRGAVN